MPGNSIIIFFKEDKMSSIFKHIQIIFRKILDTYFKNKGCRLSANKVRVISIHHAIPDAIGDYKEWKFDSNGDLIENET